LSEADFYFRAFSALIRITGRLCRNRLKKASIVKEEKKIYSEIESEEEKD